MAGIAIMPLLSELAGTDPIVSMPARVLAATASLFLSAFLGVFPIPTISSKMLVKGKKSVALFLHVFFVHQETVTSHSRLSLYAPTDPSRASHLRSQKPLKMLAVVALVLSLKEIYSRETTMLMLLGIGLLYLSTLPLSIFMYHYVAKD